MRILIDTNVILDILLKRHPHFESSYGALKHAIANDTECLVSATAVTDIYYLLRKELGDAGKARECLERMVRLVSIADVLALDIHAALSGTMADYEDAVACAVAARCKAECILTRNTKDFGGSSVPALTPQDYLNLHA